MTAEQIIAVITAAKAAGISWLKAEGLEFKVGSDPKPVSTDVVVAAPVSIDPVLPPEEEEKVKHRVEELKSVMGMDDLELIDRLFPEPKEETEAAS